MILAVDAGNTSIKVAIMKNSEIEFLTRIDTLSIDSQDKFASKVMAFFKKNRISASMIDGSIISCVVPPIAGILTQVVSKITDTEPIVVNHKIQMGFNIKLDNPSEIGADIICNTVGAKNKYPGASLVVSMGSASVVMVINAHGDMIGGTICPGLKESLDLFLSQIPHLSCGNIETPPEKLIGTNTSQAVKSGIIYGYASMIDGLIDRIITQTGKKYNLVVTGGNAEYILPHMRTKGLIFEPTLTIEGLYLLYEMNK